jgi:hypothetical protein
LSAELDGGQCLHIFWRETCTLCGAAIEHAKPKFILLVKRENKVWPAAPAAAPDEMNQIDV